MRWSLRSTFFQLTIKIDPQAAKVNLGKSRLFKVRERLKNFSSCQWYSKFDLKSNKEGNLKYFWLDRTFDKELLELVGQTISRFKTIPLWLDYWLKFWCLAIKIFVMTHYRMRKWVVVREELFFLLEVFLSPVKVLEKRYLIFWKTFCRASLKF